jgi:hypothetical protein
VGHLEPRGADVRPLPARLPLRRPRASCDPRLSRVAQPAAARGALCAR